eukprot:1157904-Pelagomonas_calceolata.AAC.7
MQVCRQHHNMQPALQPKLKGHQMPCILSRETKMQAIPAHWAEHTEAKPGSIKYGSSTCKIDE